MDCKLLCCKLLCRDFFTWNNNLSWTNFFTDPKFGLSLLSLFQLPFVLILFSTSISSCESTMKLPNNKNSNTRYPRVVRNAQSQHRVDVECDLRVLFLSRLELKMISEQTRVTVIVENYSTAERSWKQRF